MDPRPAPRIDRRSTDEGGHADMATDWVEKMKQIVQPHVDEPVLVVGLLQPAGSWGSMGISRVSPLGGVLKRKLNNNAANGLAKTGAFGFKMGLFAVTAEKIYAFHAKPKSREWLVGDKVGEWSRDDLRITTVPGRLATKVVVDVPATGQHYELEATTAGSNGFTEAFLTELTRSRV
jgi:hypothetical protein